MKTSTLNTLRWLALVPMVLASFYFCVMVAIGIHVTAEAFCPEHLVVSELCTASYMSYTKEAILFFAPVCAAVLMVACGYWCAPFHKRYVALATFILGSLAATYYAIDSGYWLTWCCTELAAGLMVFYLCKKPLSSPDEKNLD